MADRIERLSKQINVDGDNVYHLPASARTVRSGDDGNAKPTRFKAVVRHFPSRPEPALPPEGLKKVRPLGDSPSTQQMRWLARGLEKSGGKLPLFDEMGQAISRRTVKTCVTRGWVEPLFSASREPEWTVCRLTALGRAVVS